MGLLHRKPIVSPVIGIQRYQTVVRGAQEQTVLPIFRGVAS